MLRTIIEHTRLEMFNFAEMHGSTSPITVQTSQRLDHLLNLYYFKYDKHHENLQSKEILVHGSIINNISEGSIQYDSSLLPILKEFNITSMKSNKWYPQNHFQTLFANFEQKYGEQLMATMGNLVPKNCEFPRSLDSFEKCLFNLNNAYHMNHSSKDAGFYEIIATDRKEFIVICNTPFYPYSFNYGILEGLSKKYDVEAEILTTNFIKGGEFKITLG